MTNTSSRIAFWLLPATDDELLLRRRIDAYAETLGTPRFDPHLTLLALPQELVADPVSTLERLAQLAPPFSLTPTGTPQWGSLYNQAFLLPFKRSDELDLLVAALHPQQLVPDNYSPHISLIYANLDEQTGRTLEQEAEPFPQSFCFDRVAAIAIGPSCRCDADVRMWEQVAMLELQS